MTSSESMSTASPSSSTYWNSSCPGSSWQRFTTRASAADRSSSTSCSLPALAAEPKREVRAVHLHVAVRAWWSGRTTCCRARTRRCRPGCSVVSSSRTTVASTCSRRQTPCATCPARRGGGSAAALCANASRRSVLGLVAHLASSAGDSGTACGRARPGRSPAGARSPTRQIQTSVHAGGIANASIRSTCSLDSEPPPPSMYWNPLPRLRRPNPGSRSDTYLRPAARAEDSAASSIGSETVPAMG